MYIYYIYYTELEPDINTRINYSTSRCVQFSLQLVTSNSSTQVSLEFLKFPKFHSSFQVVKFFNSIQVLLSYTQVSPGQVVCLFYIARTNESVGDAYVFTPATIDSCRSQTIHTVAWPQGQVGAR
jgi:hypothetical protein